MEIVCCVLRGSGSSSQEHATNKAPYISTGEIVSIIVNLHIVWKV